MRRFLDRVKNAFGRFWAALFSRAGMIVTGSISAVYLLAMAAILTLSGVGYYDPAAYCGAEVQSLRNTVISQGQETKLFFLSEDYGDAPCYGLSKEHDGKTFEVYVGAPGRFSNYFAMTTTEPYDGYGLKLVFCTGWLLDEAYSKDEAYAFNALAILVHEDGTPFVIEPFDWIVCEEVMFSCNTQFDIVRDHDITSVEDTGLDPKVIDEINAKAEGVIRDFLPQVQAVLQEIHQGDPSGIIRGLQIGLGWINTCSGLLFLAAILSLPGGLVVSVYLLSVLAAIKAKKEKKLIEAGILPLPEAEKKEPSAKATEGESKPKEDIDRSNDLMERFVAKTHLRPVLGEWVIRGLGFALLIVGAVFIDLINGYVIEGEATNLFPLFKTMNTTGSFLLVIALIGIIAETRSGLKRNSFLFFALAVAYYFATNSAFFFFDNVIRIEFAGNSLVSMVSRYLPGNIFLGIGLFTFIGYFLFEEPPEWFIHRKVFRALAAIPTTMALASVVLSFLWSSDVLSLNYWVSSLFFVRNLDVVFGGILFEYTIFFFRSTLTKKYGKDHVDEEMERPATQFKKNMVLCLIVLVYTGIFQLLRLAPAFATWLPQYTFVWAFIPVFLFYKPAGRNRKAWTNVIYYVLYILIFLAPTIVRFVL